MNRIRFVTVPLTIKLFVRKELLSNLLMISESAQAKGIIRKRVIKANYSCSTSVPNNSFPFIKMKKKMNLVRSDVNVFLLYISGHSKVSDFAHFVLSNQHIPCSKVTMDYLKTKKNANLLLIIKPLKNAHFYRTACSNESNFRSDKRCQNLMAIGNHQL